MILYPNLATFCKMGLANIPVLSEFHQNTKSKITLLPSAFYSHRASSLQAGGHVTVSCLCFSTQSLRSDSEADTLALYNYASNTYNVGSNGHVLICPLSHSQPGNGSPSSTPGQEIWCDLWRTIGNALETQVNPYFCSTKGTVLSLTLDTLLCSWCSMIFICIRFTLKFVNMYHFGSSGLHSFLSAMLHVFIKNPILCPPLFSDRQSECIHTLGLVLCRYM